jgi:hypothetical protein
MKVVFRYCKYFKGSRSRFNEQVEYNTGATDACQVYSLSWFHFDQLVAHAQPNLTRLRPLSKLKHCILTWGRIQFPLSNSFLQCCNPPGTSELADDADNQNGLRPLKTLWIYASGPSPLEGVLPTSYPAGIRDALPLKQQPISHLGSCIDS